MRLQLDISYIYIYIGSFPKIRAQIHLHITAQVRYTV